MPGGRGGGRRREPRPISMLPRSAQRRPRRHFAWGGVLAARAHHHGARTTAAAAWTVRHGGGGHASTLRGSRRGRQTGSPTLSTHSRVRTPSRSPPFWSAPDSRSRQQPPEAHSRPPLGRPGPWGVGSRAGGRRRRAATAASARCGSVSSRRADADGGAPLARAPRARRSARFRRARRVRLDDVRDVRGGALGFLLAAAAGGAVADRAELDQ